MLGYMCEAIEIIEGCWEFAYLIPEVRSNLVYAKMGAKDPKDVLAIDGRITVVNEMPHASGRPRFGASSHMARLIITLHEHDGSIRAGINIACFPKLISHLEDAAGLSDVAIVKIDRSTEPSKTKKATEGTMSWKAREAIRLAGGKVPWIFYDTGDMGKEPIATIVGENSVQVADWVRRIAQGWVGLHR